MSRLKVADIVADSRVQSSHLEAQQVEMYRRSVGQLPPVVVYDTGEGLLLADGYHRLAAAVAEGHETIEAEVRHGSRQDALAYAVTVGAAQKDMSPEEVRERILKRHGKETPDPQADRLAELDRSAHASIDGIDRTLSRRSEMEKEVLEAYERLVSAFREGRDKFGSFADEATIVDGGRRFGSLAEYRAAWDAWKETIGHLAVPASVETRVMSLQMLGDTAVLVHSIESRERTDAGEETEREIETIVFSRQPSGRWLIVHQHLSPHGAEAGG